MSRTSLLLWGVKCLMSCTLSSALLSIAKSLVHVRYVSFERFGVNNVQIYIFSWLVFMEQVLISVSWLNWLSYVFFPLLDFVVYQSPFILTGLLHADLTNVVFLTACIFIKS